MSSKILIGYALNPPVDNFCRFSSIMMVDVGRHRPIRFTPQTVKDRPVAEACAAWLIEGYGPVWRAEEKPQKPFPTFIGFDVGWFLHQLQVEAALPESALILPPGVKQSPQCDPLAEIKRTLADARAFSPVDVARMWSPLKEDDRAAWNTMLDAWEGPGTDPAVDIVILAELAARLGTL